MLAGERRIGVWQRDRGELWNLWRVVFPKGVGLPKRAGEAEPGVDMALGDMNLSVKLLVRQKIRGLWSGVDEYFSS